MFIYQGFLIQFIFDQILDISEIIDTYKMNKNKK